MLPLLLKVLQNIVHHLGDADADGRAVRAVGRVAMERILRVLPVPVDHGPEPHLAGKQRRPSIRLQAVHQVSASNDKQSQSMVVTSIKRP